jgi:hypothetical protein
MKIRRYRQPVEKLFVLGAGASYALSGVRSRDGKPNRAVTPLDATFLNCLYAARPSNGWRRRSMDLLLSDWLDSSALLDQGLERAIIKRVSQYDLLSSLHPQRTRGKCDNAKYLNHLSHLVTAYLINCKSSRSGATRQFVNWLFPPKMDVAEYRNRVVTFNYDTLLERPLIERGVSRRKLYFDRLVAHQAEATSRRADEKFLHPLVLKLHGSVNWRCSQSDFESIVHGRAKELGKITIWSDDKPCPSPDDSTSPLIIPPIPNKPITAASIFAHLWTTAYEYLHEARELVIVGYSCPPTDTLARTMFTHFENTKLQEISIVDPNAGALTSYREMVPERISKRARWTYYADFRDYISRVVS